MGRTKNKETIDPEVVSKDPLVQSVEVRRPYTDAELAQFAKEMMMAMTIINEEQAALKEYQQDTKGRIEEQEDILQSYAAKVKFGHEIQRVVCTVKYEGNIVIFTNKETGKLVEKRELTAEEQLRLHDRAIDAETIIREDNERNG